MKFFKVFNRLHWKFIIMYFLLILIAMQVIGAYFIAALESHYVNNFTRMLDQQANVFTYSIQNYMREPLNEEIEDRNESNSVDEIIDAMFSSSHIDIQVLDRNGVVIHAPSDKQAVIGQRNTQTEVKRALLGTPDDTIRVNPQNGHRMKILSLPIRSGDEVIGAVYILASMEETFQTIREINQIMLTGTLIALALTCGLGIALARTITAPIKEMTNQATAMADGDFSRKVKIYGEDEIGKLAGAFNYLSHRLSKALSENEEERQKLSSILFNMSDGVIASDHEGNIILMNQKAEKMMGIESRDIQNVSMRELLSFEEERSFDTIIAEDGSFLTSIERNNKEIILQIKLTPIHLEDQIPHGIIAVIQDVTQQAKLEMERKEFVANVSHELRTPLTTLKSYVEALEEGGIEDQKLAQKFIHVIHNETERMIRLVNDLLKLSKMDTKNYQLMIAPTNMADFLKEITDKFQVQMKQQQLKLQLQVDSDLPEIEIDRDQMTQVLDNIITNAIKYSFQGSTIYIQAKKNKDQLIVSIKDEGVGIPEEDLPHVFQRFYRVDKARSRDMGGTGLGLSIAREMIMAHQGDIFIESDIGDGTKVSIYLPLYEREEE